MSFTTTAPWGQAQVAHHPAYNAVPARTTLMDPHSASQETPAPATPKRKEFSQALRDYVQRTFDPKNAVDGIENDEVRAKLKHMLTAFLGANEEDTIDWATHPYPQQLLAWEKAVQKDPRFIGYNMSLGWSNTPVPPTSLTTPIYSTVSNQKKRKSIEDPEDFYQTPSHSRNHTNHTMLEDRITPRDKTTEAKRHKKGKGLVAGERKLKQSEEEIERRKRRFGVVSSDELTTSLSATALNDDLAPLGPVVGTCQKLEKNYFRLTAPPKPETVRPQAVLEKALDLVRLKWKQEGHYGYANDQLKSIRQDLTVQHLKNSFTVMVYETHARIALEKADLGEYNQCQTVLRGLYAKKLGGHPDEFLAYRILYFLYTRNQMDMNDLLAELSPADKEKLPVKHALAVRSSLALGNYHKFFRLYLDPPNMGGYLMDMFIERERFAALAGMSKAYRKLRVDFLTQELGFERDEDCLAFLIQRDLQNHIEMAGLDSSVNLKDAHPLLISLKEQAFQRIDLKVRLASEMAEGNSADAGILTTTLAELRARVVATLKA